MADCKYTTSSSKRQNCKNYKFYILNKNWSEIFEQKIFIIVTNNVEWKGSKVIYANNDQNKNEYINLPNPKVFCKNSVLIDLQKVYISKFTFHVSACDQSIYVCFLFRL